MKTHKEIIDSLYQSASDSRKGENGKVLVIGGSKLFHVAPFWAAAATSKIVDMVHFSSPYLLNNELMAKRSKENFWSGIVVPWEDVDHYIYEDDVVLIGPGMERGETTKSIVNSLLAKYPDKKWVIDGGALQEVDTKLITRSMILTPNIKEMEILMNKVKTKTEADVRDRLNVAAILAKGVMDVVYVGDLEYRVSGGNPGMTKGGTGDVLSGVVAGLYAKSSALASCYVASLANKKAGESLAKTKGNYYDASEMIGVVGEEIQKLFDLPQ